ncbi:MAG: XRE family transcriptional regulator [Hyphomicrobiaceae bacterium]|nr:MAG: XRE family transcriptional regulator [Hyphomicrobiaceae bacterium]
MYLVTAEMVRVEMARHMITRAALAREIGMDRSVLSSFCSGKRMLTTWSRHNIGLGMNRLTGLMIFDVDMAKPYVKPKPGWPLGRPRPELPKTKKSSKNRKKMRRSA